LFVHEKNKRRERIREREKKKRGFLLFYIIQEIIEVFRWTNSLLYMISNFTVGSTSRRMPSFHRKDRRGSCYCCQLIKGIDERLSNSSLLAGAPRVLLFHPIFAFHPLFIRRVLGHDRGRIVYQNWGTLCRLTHPSKMEKTRAIRLYTWKNSFCRE